MMSWVANWGNLANRVLSFANKHWEGHVPDPGELTEADKELLKIIEKGFESVSAEIESVRLRAALGETLRLATEVNRYLDQKAPWSEVKVDKAAAGRTIYTALRAIDSLKILFSPFIPFSSQKLHTYMGYEGNLYGEQIIKEQKDDMGEHTVLSYDCF